MIPAIGWLLCLASLPHMGPRRLEALVAGRDPAEVWADVVRGAWRVDAQVVERCGADWPAVRKAWVQAAVGLSPEQVWGRHADFPLLRRGEPGYPVRLVDDPEPPPFLVGTRPVEVDAPVVAVVGTRRCTGYGRDVARELGRDLAESGVIVASGLALGIDAAAHAGALEVDGAPPLGVVATGLDVVYPRRNRSLWRRVEERGVLVTEQPLGTAPTRWRFPARNRILAGLADVVVVVESHARGGSMHTVASALERNVPVLAVPGPITSRPSDGTNALIADGAVPVTGVDDVMTALGLSAAGRRPPSRAVVDGPLAEVLRAVDVSPTTVDTVALRTGRPVTTLHADLVALERQGLVEHEAGWWRARGHGGAGERTTAGSDRTPLS